MPRYTTEAIRNLALVGTAGTGKTTLIESILHVAGVIGRPGRVEEGSTVCDSDDLEKEFRQSFDSAVVHLDFAGAHVNLIDTPGAADFLGRALCVLPAVEVVALVLDAGGGIDATTRRLMAAAEQTGLPRMIIVNKMDNPGDMRELLARVQEAFGSECRPINLPAGGCASVVDCFAGESGDSDLGPVSEFHTGLVDQVVEIDDRLMERYLEEGTIALDELRASFKTAMRQGHVIPVCFVSARAEIGVRELLQVIADLCPSPREAPPRTFECTRDGETRRFAPEADPAGPVLAHVFRVSSDPYVGKLCAFRVHRGTIGHQSQPLVDDRPRPVRIAHVFKLQGRTNTEADAIIAGDVGAVAKVEELAYNSVIHDGREGPGIRFPRMPLPRPMYGLAVEATSKGVETKLAEALHKLVAEDPTLEFERVQATSETVLRGLGEQHLRMKLRLLKDRYGVAVETRPPRVAYKETVTVRAEGHHRHKKQTGGAGQFGEVFLRVEPIPEGADEAVNGLLFVDDTFGGSIPRQFIPAVEKGVRQVMSEGAVAGYPMKDIKVSVYDGKHHPVDSKEVAFVTAGRKAFIDGVRKARPVLLEPYVKLEIIVPAGMIGDISSDIAGRRGRIQGTDMLPGDQAVIKVEAPLAEVMSYSSQLKSITGGAGSYTMEYSHDEPTPPNVQEQVIRQYKPRAEED